MKQCEYLDDCSFFNGGFKEHSIGEFLLNDYCFGTPDFCAIHVTHRSLGDEDIPDGLLPHELDRVKNLV